MDAHTAYHIIETLDLRAVPETGVAHESEVPPGQAFMPAYKHHLHKLPQVACKGWYYQRLEQVHLYCQQLQYAHQDLALLDAAKNLVAVKVHLQDTSYTVQSGNTLISASYQELWWPASWPCKHMNMQPHHHKARTSARRINHRPM